MSTPADDENDFLLVWIAWAHQNDSEALESVTVLSIALQHFSNKWLGPDRSVSIFRYVFAVYDLWFISYFVFMITGIYIEGLCFFMGRDHLQNSIQI